MSELPTVKVRISPSWSTDTFASVSTTLEPLLTARDLADRLAVSSNTILDWWQQGRLPGFKLHSGAVRFRESEIVAWLEAQRA